MKIKKFSGLTLVSKKEVLNMYAVDLKSEISVVKPAVTVKVSLMDRAAEVDILNASTVAARTARGDKFFVAHHQGILVAYLFAATKECQVGEIDDWLDVGLKEVYLYDAYTRPVFRGKGIYSHLITKAAEYFRSESYRHAMIFSTGDNLSSNRAIERCGFKLYETVRYRNFMGWKSWEIKLGGRHVGSRLRIEI
ncbi:MAG: GNAT family N-acetyltransferase [candidate division WOR-3 bacterium]|nr:MAG: GNAT family N-acetyltransferase [candidate division WOR-3 bacterium]